MSGFLGEYDSRQYRVSLNPPFCAWFFYKKNVILLGSTTITTPSQCLCVPHPMPWRLLPRGVEKNAFLEEASYLSPL